MRLRVFVLVIASGLTLSIGALALVPVSIVTLFSARRLYAVYATRLARLILGLWRIRVLVHPEGAFPHTQTVYISNHSSTLDLFVLVALGLPNTRFFLSGYLRKYVPLGFIAQLMGTFFTAPQSQPAKRIRIFQRADRILRSTGESVYLSPEGGRIATGEIGPFNKGAFRLATSLRAPIVPLYFHIPREIDPGLGFAARPGDVHVYVMPAIDTSAWRIEQVNENKDRTRDAFIRWHRAGADHVESAGAA